MKNLTPREEKIRETISLCQEAHYRQSRTCLMTWWEFLWTQLHYTRKRWWALQSGLLLLAWQMIPDMESHYHQLRSLGVVGCLFVVLMIPELWRNRESDSTQVEAACRYSLRQIYAARITLFGLADVTLLTVFGLGLGSRGFTWMEVLFQFLLPVTGTACICFSQLCGRHSWNETMSVAACLLFGAGWWLLMMNEQIYTRIVPGVWLGLFGMSVSFLALAVRRTVRTTNRIWEADSYGITTG